MNVPHCRYETLDVAKPSGSAPASRSFLFRRAFLFDRHTCTYFGRETWPAISDIWLGIRTVPVLSVAKESRGASQIAHWPRSARTQAGRCGLTDRRSSVKKLLSVFRLLMFPSLLEEITGHGMSVECSKLTCFAKVKIRHGSRAVRSTIEVGRCQSSFAYCEAEFDLGKGKKRSKPTYPH